MFHNLDLFQLFVVSVLVCDLFFISSFSFQHWFGSLDIKIRIVSYLVPTVLL